MEHKKPIVIDSAACEWQTRDAYQMTEQGRVRWKTLLSGERTASHSLTMGLLELPPREQLVRHRHQPVETYYILTGTGQVEVEGEIYPLSGGSAVFVPANAGHQLTNTGPTVMQVIYTFPIDAFAEVAYVYDK